MPRSYIGEHINDRNDNHEYVKNSYHAYGKNDTAYFHDLVTRWDVVHQLGPF